MCFPWPKKGTTEIVTKTSPREKPTAKHNVRQYTGGRDEFYLPRLPPLGTGHQNGDGEGTS